MFAYRIVKVSDNLYVAQYKRNNSWAWKSYANGEKSTWEEAYKVLEQHANPAQLQVKFVGTF